MADPLLQRVVLDPKVMAGKPIIRGTRVPVETVVRMLSQGMTEQAILAEYPRLEPDDLRAALAFAAQVLGNDDFYPAA